MIQLVHKRGRGVSLIGVDVHSSAPCLMDRAWNGVLTQREEETIIYSIQHIDRSSISSLMLMSVIRTSNTTYEIVPCKSVTLASM